MTKWLLADNFDRLHFDRAKAREWKMTKWLLADNFDRLHFDRAKARGRGNAEHFRGWRVKSADMVLSMVKDGSDCEN